MVPLLLGIQSRHFTEAESRRAGARGWVRGGGPELDGNRASVFQDDQAPEHGWSPAGLYLLLKRTLKNGLVNCKTACYMHFTRIKKENQKNKNNTNNLKPLSHSELSSRYNPGRSEKDGEGWLPAGRWAGCCPG